MAGALKLAVMTVAVQVLVINTQVNWIVVIDGGESLADP